MEAYTVENDDIVVEDEPVQDVLMPVYSVKRVAVEDVAVTAEDVAVEVEGNRDDDTSASKTMQSPSDATSDQSNDSVHVDDDINSLAEKQNQHIEPSNGATTFDKNIIVTEISTETPQNSGDGGILSAEIPKYNEDNPSAGPSNVRIKKSRKVHTVILEKRVGLPRKSKTNAYEYLKNIAKGFYAAATTKERRRVGHKRLKPIVRGNKSNPSRKRNEGRGPNAKRFRVVVQDRTTSISSRGAAACHSVIITDA